MIGSFNRPKRTRFGWIAGAMFALGLVFGTSAHAQPFLGEWDMQLDYQGAKIPSKLKLESKDGVVSGAWSSERGENPVSDIKFENGKLTFTRKISFQGQEFELNYEGTIDGEKITGKFSTPMGDLEANGSRVPGTAPAPPAPAPAASSASAVGAWEITVDSPLGVNKRKITFSQELKGVYEADYGTFETRNVKLDGNKLTFDLTLAMEGQSLELSFTGTIDGDKLSGEFQSEQGGATVQGVRLSAEAAAPPAGAGVLGKWNLTIDAPDGQTYSATLNVSQVDGRNAGRLVTELGEMDIQDIKVEGDKVSFATEVDFGGNKMPFAFEGKLDGAKIAGTVSVDFEGQKMELPLAGELVEPAVAVAAAAPAGGAGALDGKWEMAIESPDGATYEGKLTVSTAGGTTSGVLVTELGEVKIDKIDVAGADASFATNVDFGGTQVPLSFKGKIDGETIAGAVNLNFDGQEMEMPITGKRVEGAAVAAAPAAGGGGFDGNWNLAIESPDGATYEGKLTVSTAGGVTSGLLVTELGEVKIEKIDVAGADASFATTVDFGGTLVPLGFKGSIDGAKVAGVVSLDFNGQQMEMPVTGEREGGAPATAAAPAPAGGAFDGEWALALESPDGATYDGKLTATTADGTTSAVLVTELGEIKIEKINIAGDALDFSTNVDFGGTMVPLSFAGKLDGSKVSGVVKLNFDGQEMELPLTGERKGGAPAATAAPAAGGADGAWSLAIESPDGATYEGDLTVTSAGGKTSGVLVTELGEVKIDSLNTNGDAVDFATTVDFGGTQVPLSFAGKIEGDSISGQVKLSFDGQEMEMPVTGKRKGGAAAASGDASQGLGVWEVTVETPDGAAYDGTLTFKRADDGKLTGMLDTPMGSIEVPGVVLDGSNVSFGGDVDIQGTKVPVSFTGTIADANLTGSIKLNYEGQELQVPVKGKKAAEKAASSSSAGLVGKWDCEVTLPDGATSYSTLTVVEEGGKLSAELYTELGTGKIPEIQSAGGVVSFDAKVDLGGVAIPIKFSGSVSGDKLSGTVNMEMDGQEMEIPLTGKKQAAPAAAAAPKAETKTASACCAKPNCGPGCKGSAGCGACCTS